MPVPELEKWQARWKSPQRERLGVRAVGIADGSASFVVDLPYGDERDNDPLFISAALTHAADIAAVSAVIGHLDEGQQTNGTASMHFNFVAVPSSTVTIEARVFAWDTHQALLDIVGTDGEGQLAIRGLVTFSLRPRSTEVAS